MGQTTVIFPRLKRAYRAIVKNPTVDRAVHKTLDAGVSLYAALRGFAFPTKFNWDWKWEMLSGAYERDTADLFARLIKPGMTVVDIGAHVGYFTRLYADLVGPAGAVFAFEADPKNFALLERNVRGRANVRLFKDAIADREGTLDFFETDNNTGCHSLIATATRPHKLSVPATTLDRLFANGTIPKIDVIKMDIEGAEPQALRGMTQAIRSNPHLALVVELCPANLTEGGVSTEAFLAQLHDLGLRTFAITADGLKEITPDLARQGNFFIKPNYHYVNVYASQNPVV